MIILSVASAIFGGLTVIAVLKIKPDLLAKIENKKHLTYQSVFDDILENQDAIHRQLDSLFDDDFFDRNDPFEEMRKMREEMNKRMERFGTQNSTNPFDSWFSLRFGGGTIHDISKREDDDFVYYDIKVDDLNSASVSTKIENGYIAITGSVEKRHGNDDEDSHSAGVYRSTFNRTFPLPDYVDQNKMEMFPEGNKITLKFPKIKQ
jgi:HSP20 family molecular chaperone IbpA